VSATSAARPSTATPRSVPSDRCDVATGSDNLSFDAVAELYDSIRPGYPDELNDAAWELAGLAPGDRMLEVGCGSGLATEPFARRGLAVTGLEPGPKLAAVARRRLAGLDARVLETSFEEWAVEEGAFRAVLAAQVFHWIDPAVAYPRSADALAPGGHLLLLWHTHPKPFEGFFEESQEIYARLMPESLSSNRAQATQGQGGVDARRADVEASGRFGAVEARTHDWRRPLSRDDYMRLLGTYSDHNALPEDRRRRLLDELAALIDTRYGGEVVRPYRTFLLVAPRR